MEKKFELKSFALSDYGTDIKYRLTETDENGMVTENDYHVKNTRPVHPDLQGLFDKELTAIVAAVFDEWKLLHDMMNGEAHNLPNSVSFAGKNDNAGIAIGGTLQTSYGEVVFRTPRIKFSESRISAKLTMFAAALVKEVQAYLDGKSAEWDVL